MSENINLNDLKKERIRLEEAKECINTYFRPPKYTSYILNEIVRNSKANYPNIVGQMTELTKQNKDKTQKEWEEWYLENYPDAIDNSTEKAYEMLLKHKEAINLIDKDMVKKYITDLVLVKSRKGLIYHDMVFNYLAEKEDSTYRLATPEEESKGIDGYVGEKPLQIKPHTYLNNPRLQEEFTCDIVIYKDTGTYLEIYYEE